MVSPKLTAPTFLGPGVVMSYRYAAENRGQRGSAMSALKRRPGGKKPTAGGSVAGAGAGGVRCRARRGRSRLHSFQDVDPSHTPDGPDRREDLGPVRARQVGRVDRHDAVLDLERAWTDIELSLEDGGDVSCGVGVVGRRRARGRGRRTRPRSTAVRCHGEASRMNSVVACRTFLDEVWPEGRGPGERHDLLVESTRAGNEP
jgi:hypothetical protein